MRAKNYRINNKKSSVFKGLLQLFFMVPVILFFFGISQGRAHAAVGNNQQINFQGKLVNSDGTNAADATYSVIFSIYSVSSAGTALWTETDSVTTSNGIFQVALGANTSLSSINFNTNPLYLGIKISTEASEMTPRILFSSVPYAQNASTLDGVVATPSATGFTLTGGQSTPKTLTVSDATTLSTNAISFGGGEVLTLSANNALTLNTTGSTSVTLPTGGTLLTNTSSANQTVASSQTTGTVLGITDATNITAATTGLAITLSGSGAFDQTGLSFNLSGASGTNLNDIVGSGSSWKISRAGAVSDTSQTITPAASTTGLTITQGNVPTVDIASITNVGHTASANGVNGLQISFDSGPTNTTDQNGALRVNITNKGTGAGQVNGIRIVSTGPGGSVASDTVGLAIDGLTNSSTGTNNENAIEIGSGWDNAISASGNILIGAQADATSSYASLMSTAGTFGSQTGVAGATSSAEFKGKLFVATRSINGAGVYRYDGGTTWTLVTNAPGKAIAADTANIDGYSMIIYNGKLFIGSQTGQGTGTAAIYYSSDADTAATPTWTLVNTTRGRFATNTGIDAVDDMEVVNGILYAIGAKVNAGEIYRWAGGTGTSVFTALNNVAGKIVSADAADFDGGVLQAYNGQLWVGVNAGAEATARIFEYEGDNGTAGAGFRLMNTTRGRFDTTTGMKAVTAMAVFNGSLYVAATKGAGTAELYRYTSGTSNGTPGVNVFNNINTAGKLDTSVDTTAVINAITTMKAYNGMFFIGTDSTSANNVGAVYQYDRTLSPNFVVVGTRGTFGSETNVDTVDSLIVYNNALYVGTDEPTKGSLYSFTKSSQNSYMLEFDSGGGNLAGLGFEASTQADNHTGHDGTFFFTNSVALTTGAFDYAEDYPTKDDSLTAGDVVSIDPTTPQFVAKSGIGAGLIGVVSSNPGFDLQATATDGNTARYVPVALVGRVPVNVSVENGVIHAGDYLTASPTNPGVAVKAIHSGPVLGRVMEDYSSSAVGQVTVFVNVSYYDGVHDVAAGLSGNGAILADMIDEQATPEGSITSEMNVLGASDSAVLSATADAALSRLTVDGLATFSADLRVKQNALVEGILSVIDTLKTNQLIATGIADFFDHVVFHSDVLFVGRPIFTADTAGFAVIHKDSQEVDIIFDKPYTDLPIVNANIAFNQPTPTGPVGSVDSLGQDILSGDYHYIITNKTTKGFRILLNKKATEDISFSWIAIAVQNPKIIESVAGAQTQVTQTPTPTPQFDIQPSVATGSSQ